ncbi:uncharacterized protein ACNLHF_025943 isoform 2-T2 [Anomaloglossus baeobatrachus]|uniref:uncharacterized protein LOC142246474 n=1 Tax=Anomaloglossus baeobatrachus TaxID=238106 RepID=UPI003F4F945F
MQSPVADSEDTDTMREALSSYKPGSSRNLQGHGFTRVCLQLFGLEGDGKSSLINSCLCVVHNLPFSNEAGSGTSAESFTTTREEYKLTDMVYIVDNRGLKNVTKDARLEVSAQLRNLRSMSRVDWEFESERTLNQLDERCNHRSVDFIVPVLVRSVDRLFSKNVMDEFSPLLRDAFEITGIFPIVVLTKNNGQSVAEIQKLIEDLGPQHIFLLDNYTTTNTSRSGNTDSKVLKFLHVCLQEADRGIQKKQKRNVQWELLKQATDQIKAEMKRQKELEKEELDRKDDLLRKKEEEIIQSQIQAPCFGQGSISSTGLFGMAR